MNRKGWNAKERILYFDFEEMAIERLHLQLACSKAAGIAFVLMSSFFFWDLWAVVGTFKVLSVRRASLQQAYVQTASM